MAKVDLSRTTEERKRFWGEVRVVNDRNDNVNVFIYYATGLSNSLYLHYESYNFQS